MRAGYFATFLVQTALKEKCKHPKEFSVDVNIGIITPS